MQSQEIKRIRKELKLTQKEFAEKLGVSYTAVNRWERGHNEPQPDRLAKLMELRATYDARSQQAALFEELPAPPPDIDYEGDPEGIKLVVDAFRLRNGHLFNRAYALELSRVVPLPHQRIAVYEHMLNLSPLRYLLADDAGAGKTIMTGLYILEMLNRGRIRRVLICCPAGLVYNWQRELRFFFELNFTVLRGADFRDRNPVETLSQGLFVVSVDTAATESTRVKLAVENRQGFDLVVFDEAHKLSWGDPNRQESKTQRYRLAEDLAQRSINLLLLTATPHMGKEFPYYALWRLLDSSVFSTPDALITMPKEKRDRHFIRRLKEEMVTYDGQPIYKPRLTQTIPVKLTRPEIDFYEAATAYLRWSFENNRSLNRNAAAMVVAVLQRRLASSTHAMLESIKRMKVKRIKMAEQVEHVPEARISRMLAEIVSTTADDSEPTLDGRESFEEIEEQLVDVVRPANQELLQHELILIEKLIELGGKVEEDAKFTKLRELIESPQYHHEKVLVFTEHRDTLLYLQSQFEGMGHTGKIAVIHGGVDAMERERQRIFFMPEDLRSKLVRSEDLARYNPPAHSANLMLATDAAGEGINLQFAWIMVNYDIPWNPARLEQRMGRLHRFGQRHNEVRIFNLVAKEDTREGDVLAALLQKLEEARNALSSDKVFDVIGQQLPESSIRDLLLDRLMHPESTEWKQQIDAWTATQKLRDAINKIRKQASEFGDVGKRIHQLKDEMEIEGFSHLLPSYVQNFVEKAAVPLGLEIQGDLSQTASLTGKEGAPAWLTSLLSRLPDGLPDFVSVRRDPPEHRDASKVTHFLRPSDPLFEGICDAIEQRYAADAQRGAIFADPTVDAPYGVAFYICQIGERNDTATGQISNLLDRRLIAVRWTEDGVFETCPPNHILALQPASKSALWRAHRLLKNPEDQLRRADQNAKALADAQFLQKIRTSIKVEADARADDLARGFDFRSAELAERRANLARKSREGDAAALEQLAVVKEEQARLHDVRATAILREHRRSELLDIVEFRRVACGLVIPDASPEAQEAYDRNIEQIAIRIARNYEVDHYGAKVIDVSAPHLAKGYDLESYRSNGDIVAIEVKGRARRGSVQLTENEWPTAANVRDRYWLYVAVDCATSPVLYRVQDPAFKLAVKSRQSFTIQFGDIVREAEPD